MAGVYVLLQRLEDKDLSPRDIEFVQNERRGPTNNRRVLQFL